jgi:hypothetical protein
MFTDGHRDDAEPGERSLALDLAKALWPAQAGSLRVCMVAEGRHRSRAEVRHEESTIVAAGDWAKTAAMDSLISCLQSPCPPSPWTYHARRAQAAERGHDWLRASQEWKHSEQAVATFGGADKAQLARMCEREGSATSVPIWLHEHDEYGQQTLDWYLAEASAAGGRGDEMLEYTLCRLAWGLASQAWRRGGFRDAEQLDSIIGTAKRLAQEVALA